VAVNLGRNVRGTTGSNESQAPLERLDGKVALVTGGSQGMGKEIARGLARRGARVLIVARDLARTQAAAAEVSATTNNPAVEGYSADLTSLAAVRTFAAELLSQHAALDILVNNAGGHFQRRRESVDGIELSWAINFFAPFLLTNLLLAALRKGSSARIVNVASSAMSKSLSLLDLQRKEKFHSWRAYGEAKLSLVMFTYAAARRLAGTPLTVNCLHPGLVATSVADSAAPTWMPHAILTFIKLFLLSPKEGAKTALTLACASELAGVSGRHFVRGRGRRSVPISYEQAEQERIWQLGERSTGITWSEHQ
jgi:retinol dehydrogenase-12